MVIISLWIGNELGDSTSWQTPPYPLATFGVLPIMWLRKHSPGGLIQLQRIPRPSAGPHLPSVSLGLPFRWDKVAFFFISMCDTMSYRIQPNFLVFLECIIPWICKQKRDNGAKLKWVEWKGCHCLLQQSQRLQDLARVMEIIYTKGLKKIIGKILIN